jgi:hypothetical protein
VVADPLTRLPLAARLSRLDVSQSTNVCIMLDSMMDKHSGITKGLSLFGANQGYASHQVVSGLIVNVRNFNCDSQWSQTRFFI